MALGPKPNVPFSFQCRYIGTNQGQPWVNVFHMQYQGGTPTTTDANAFATSLRSAWLTNLAPIHHNGVTLTFTDVTDLASRTGAVGTNGTAATGSGTPTSPLSTSIAMCVSFKAALRFRGGHPRMYLPARNFADTSAGHLWQSAYTTSIQGAMNSWLTAVNAITSGTISGFLSYVSFYTHDANGNPIYHPEGPHQYPITGIQVHGRIDSMRRRLGKEVA